MQYIKEHSDLAVPRVFAYAPDENNPAAVAYMLIEVLPGIIAMDALGGHEVHRGVIPTQYRRQFYRSVATCHVRLSPLLFDSIRSLHSLGSDNLHTTPKDWHHCSKSRGGIRARPLTRDRRPVHTAAPFFEAWADNVKFKWDDETIGRMMQRGPIPAERMISIINKFPSQIKAMASRLSASNNGPFPLCHDDFLHSNIMVDETSFDVTGIIDWEGACTVPWELIAFPEFLQVIPVSFDLPEKYDRVRQPHDQEVRQRWRERQEYIELVRSAEPEDHLLSTCLSSERSQALAYACGAFTSIGKLGFYDRVIEEVETES